MFFVARCAFWLGLVYSSMEWPGDGRLPNDLKDAAKPVAARAVDSSVATIRKTCVANLATCVEGAARINRLVGDAADALASKQVPKPSAHTLTAQDVAPVWRGAPKPSPRGKPHS